MITFAFDFVGNALIWGGLVNAFRNSNQFPLGLLAAALGASLVAAGSAFGGHGGFAVFFAVLAALALAVAVKTAATVDPPRRPTHDDL